MSPPTGDPVAKLRKALRGKAAEALSAAAALDPGPVDLPGPTGEANALALAPRGTVACLGPGDDLALDQAVQALAVGNRVVMASPGAQKQAATLAREGFAIVGVDAVQGGDSPGIPEGFDAVAWCGGDETLCSLRRSLAAQAGPIVTLVSERIYPVAFAHERSICVDTTAAGGNATLLAEAG